jgi:hypothetical protein
MYRDQRADPSIPDGFNLIAADMSHFAKNHAGKTVLKNQIVSQVWG